jgi:DNA replication protein DnaC
MTNQATIEQMNTLRLWGMKTAFSTYLDSNSQLDAQELLAQLVEAEYLHRNNAKIERLLRAAKFRYTAQIADIDFLSTRGLDKALLLKLSAGHLIQAKENLIITGATGVGKSFIASAIGQQACRLGYKTLYFNIKKLFHQLRKARADETYLKLMQKIEKQDLIILDDFGLQPLEQQQRQALLEIIEDRHQRKATIITSQFPVDQWHAIIGENALADAILDRLVHQAHRIPLKGNSMRKKKSQLNKPQYP